MNSDKSSQTIAFVPARSGSKSIPLKNIKPFAGKALIYWVLDALEDSNVDQIVVSTDGAMIKDCVLQASYSKVKIYDRSPESATDTASTEMAMLEYLNENYHDDSDTFILVQATSPFLSSNDINEALTKFTHYQYDSLLSVVRNHNFLWSQDGKSLNYDYQHRPRRQDFQSQFQENGAFYISTIEKIKNSKNRLSGKIGLFEMSKYSSIELDDPLDWAIAESIMEKLKNNH